MAPQPGIDLEDMHAAIVAHLAEAVPQFRLVASYPDLPDGPGLPACLVELDDMEAAPDHDHGTGQLAMMARWRARVLFGFRTEGVAYQVRKAAAVVATAVNGQRWGLPVDAARVTLVVPDPFEPALDQYEVWAVEWEQVVWLGENAWPEEGPVPSRLFIGHAPAVGPDHVEDYDEVTPGAEV